jgi:hypothetical protein
MHRQLPQGQDWFIKRMKAFGYYEIDEIVYGECHGVA